MVDVYVLRSLRDGKLYIGLTGDREKRIKKHNAGGVSSTRYRRPLEMIYHETYETLDEARRREKLLKSGPGHQFIRGVLGTGSDGVDQADASRLKRPDRKRRDKSG